MDIAHGPFHDLTDPVIEALVRKWIVSKKLWCIWFGTPCTWKSVARTTRNVNAQNMKQGEACARATIRLIECAHRHGVHYIIENPQSSGLWSWPPMQRRLRRTGAVRVSRPFCFDGTPYQKYTSLCGTVPNLCTLEAKCRCSLPHEHLQGMVLMPQPGTKPKWVWKTTLAGRYPPALCRRVANLLAACAPDGGLRAVGEPVIARHWLAELGNAIGSGPVATPVPTCPRRCVCEWAGALDFRLENDSRLLRAAAIERLHQARGPSERRAS